MSLRAPLLRAARLNFTTSLGTQYSIQASPRRLVSFTASNSKYGPRRSFLWLSTLAVTALVASVATSPLVHLDSDVAKDIQSKFDEDTEVVTDPATSLEFPKTIRVPAKLNVPPLTFVGVGVRTVSFLGVKVYSVGFYADLSNPNLRITKDMSPEEKVEHIIRNTACIIRIVPTRSTNYTHLRDAFMRAMQSRLAAGIKDGTISEQLAVEAATPLRKLKSIFPNSPLAKRTSLDILLTPPSPERPRALVLRDLGSIESDWVSTEFVLNYFDKEAPSPALKKAVLENVGNFEK